MADMPTVYDQENAADLAGLGRPQAHPEVHEGLLEDAYVTGYDQFTRQAIGDPRGGTVRSDGSVRRQSHDGPEGGE